MRTATLHNRVVQDLDVVMKAVGDILPAKMPKRYEGRTFNLSSFIRSMNVRTEPLGVFHERHDDLEMPENSVVVSGLWLPQNELPENGSSADVRLLWHVHPATKRVSMTPTQWERRRFYFWERLSHELVHRHQDGKRVRTEREPFSYRVRSTERSRKEKQAYYGNYDELEAYAHDAALEFVIWFPDMSFKSAAALASSVPVGHPVGPTWTDYLGAFDKHHPAVRAFKAKTRSWWGTLRAAPEFYERLRLPKLLCSTSFNT